MPTSSELRAADAIVVGSGPVGVVTARRLAESGRRVLVLEQGVAISDPPGSHLRNAEPLQREPDAFFASADPHFDYFDRAAAPAGLPGACTTAAVGGQGVLWTNNCPRAVRGLERPDLLADEEWGRCYGVAEAYLGVHADAFAGSVRQRRIAERLAAVLAPHGRSVIPQAFAGRVLGAGRIHYGAPADVLAAAPRDVTGRIEIAHGPALRIADGVCELADGRHLRADAIVVAAGAFDTPRLLHRSGIRPAALGRGLTYHPVAFAQLVLDDALVAGVDEADLPPRLQVPPTASHPWNVMVLRDTNPLAEAASERDVAIRRLVEIQCFCPLEPDPARAMRISEDGSVSFDVPFSAQETERMAAVVDDMHAVAAALGRFRSGCEPRWLELGFAHVSSASRTLDSCDALPKRFAARFEDDRSRETKVASRDEAVLRAGSCACRRRSASPRAGTAPGSQRRGTSSRRSLRPRSIPPRTAPSRAPTRGRRAPDRCARPRTPAPPARCRGRASSSHASASTTSRGSPYRRTTSRSTTSDSARARSSSRDRVPRCDRRGLPRRPRRARRSGRTAARGRSDARRPTTAPDVHGRGTRRRP
ncbi:MAG: hypothetical protein FJ144_12120 [Deltaproteobacteria bacterium]|nr:hypothetical protein [Deltaproteobacteria bacterium]